MPISWDTKNKRWRYQFNRVIEGRRRRASRLLPKGWTQAQADAYDRKESARIYAVVTGVEKPDELISRAVLLYLADKGHLKSFKATRENLRAIEWAYRGRRMSELQEVAKEVSDNREGAREGVKLSAATVKNRLAILKAACRWAWRRHGLCDHDPTVRMQLPTVNNERHVYIDRLQMLRLARAATRHDVRVLIRVAFYTGMRLSEILAATVSGGALHLATTKRGERRSIPAHPRIATCLRYLPLTAPKITLQRGWQQARAACGLEHVHLHDLRHSAASEMINADVDLYTVGAVLGHKDPRSTQRYAHLRHGTLADAVGRIGRKSSHKAA